MKKGRIPLKEIKERFKSGYFTTTVTNDVSELFRRLDEKNKEISKLKRQLKGMSSVTDYF